MPVAILAALPEIWPAVAILLLLWAIIWIFQKPISTILGAIPAIGGDLAAAFRRGLDTVISWAFDWAGKAVSPLVELVNAPITWLRTVLDNIALTFEAVGRGLETLWAVVGNTASAAWSGVLTLQRTVADLVDLAAAGAAELANLADKVARIITVRIPAAISKAVDRAVAVAADLVAAAVGTLTRAVDTLRSWAQARVGELRRGLDALSAAVPALIAQAVAVAVAPLQAGLGQLGQAIDGFRTDVLGRLGVISSALAPILALELVRVVPQVISKITTMERECVTPTCNVMRPQLDTLNALLTGVQVALLLELVHSAVDDPVGTAHASAGAIDGLAGLVNSVTGADTGLRI